MQQYDPGVSTQWPFLQLAGSSHSFTSVEQKTQSSTQLDKCRMSCQGHWEMIRFYSPATVAITHFFLLLSGVQGRLQLQQKAPSVLTQRPLVHRDSSWHSFTSDGVHANRKKQHSSVSTKYLQNKGFLYVPLYLSTHQCTREGCHRSRSPVDSSTRSPAACSHSDPSCRFHQQTKSTRRYLQTRKKKSQEQTAGLPIKLFYVMRTVYQFHEELIWTSKKVFNSGCIFFILTQNFGANALLQIIINKDFSLNICL